MTVLTASSRWEDLDEATRERLDARFREELSSWDEKGLTEEGVQLYLEYRRERPTAAITTFEEGRIRAMLHRHVDPSGLPDPVEAEEHTDAVEIFGAERFHLTNAQTYVAIMLVLTLAAVVTLVVWVM